MPFRSRHSLALRWTLLVALWMAFAPTLTHLWGARAGLAMVELCSSFGVRPVWVSVDALQGDAGGHDTDVAASGHCPYCLNPPQLGPVPLSHFGFEPPRLGQVLVERLRTAPDRPEPARLAHAPRAPPLSHV